MARRGHPSADHTGKENGQAAAERTDLRAGWRQLRDRRLQGRFEGHPAWYLNLVADPNVEVQIDAETFAARASTVKGLSVSSSGEDGRHLARLREVPATHRAADPGDDAGKGLTAGCPACGSEAGSKLGDLLRGVRLDGIAVAHQQHSELEPGEFANRLVGLIEILA